MRSALLMITLAAWLVSCGSKDKLPSNVLEPRKMKIVMWDMMRADQFLSEYVFSRKPGSDTVKESFTIYKQIFSLHGITKEQFAKSFDYYRNHPALFKPLMDSIAATPVSAQVDIKTPEVKDTASKKDTAGKPQRILPEHQLPWMRSKERIDSLRKARMQTH